MYSEVVKKRSPPSYKENEMLRAALRLVLTGVLLLYLMIWLVMPTNTYKQIWLPNMRKKFNSTYFGRQGLILWLICFLVFLPLLSFQ